MTTTYRTVNIYDPDNVERVISFVIVSQNASGLALRYECTLDDFGRGSVSLPCNYRYEIRRPNSLTHANLPLSTAPILLYDWAGVSAREVAAGGDLEAFWNGTFRESFDALVTSDGATVTMSLEQSGGGDLTMRFSDGLTTLDCTPAATITLTLGTDSSPQENYIYIPQSTKILTRSTSAWPSGEHIRVAYFLVPSAAYVQSDGCYINQNWNDHLTGTDNQGHLSHIGAWIRRQKATYFSGVDPDGTTDYLTISGTTVYFKSTAGEISQHHIHTYTAKDSSSDVVHVVNWNGDAYHNINNLYDITTDSTGATIGLNKWFNLVVWGVANKTGEYEPLMINLPSGFYNAQSDAETDVNGYDEFSIPSYYVNQSSTGFLICRITVQMKAATWDYGSYVDLRGLNPQTASGGSSTGDPNAVHLNVSGEIQSITAKATPVGPDFLLIEDSEDTYAKKRITMGAIDHDALTNFVEAEHVALPNTIANVLSDAGTMANQAANAVAITGGTISGITDLAVADGGTGASSASTARTNLGLGTMATQNANAVAITGGTIASVKMTGSYFALPGEHRDNSFFGPFDRNQCANAHVKGNISITFTGAGSAASDKNSLVDGTGSVFNISGTDNTTTKIEIVVDTGGTQSNYASGWWQPFLAYRFNVNAGKTTYKKITCELSMDGITYYTETGWSTTDASVNEAAPGIWMGESASCTVGGAYVWRYARFTLEDRVEDSGYAYKDYVWITQLGFRHAAHRHFPTYVQSAGDEIYGDFEFTDDSTGVVLKDRTTGTNYRLYVNSGSLSIESA